MGITEFRAAGAQRSPRLASPLGTRRVVQELAAEAHLELLGVPSLCKAEDEYVGIIAGKRNQSLRLTLVGPVAFGVEFALVAFKQHNEPPQVFRILVVLQRHCATERNAEELQRILLHHGQRR
jgi:hypothetical protein